MSRIKITSDHSAHGFKIGSVIDAELAGQPYGERTMSAYRDDCVWYINSDDYEIVEDVSEVVLTEDEIREIIEGVTPDDPVNPRHYIDNLFEEELFEVMVSNFTEEELRGYCKGNALKYRIRAGRKSDKIEEDIKKALWYESKYLNS